MQPFNPLLFFFQSWAWTCVTVELYTSFTEYVCFQCFNDSSKMPRLYTNLNQAFTQPLRLLGVFLSYYDFKDVVTSGFSKSCSTLQKEYQPSSYSRHSRRNGSSYRPSREADLATEFCSFVDASPTRKLSALVGGAHLIDLLFQRSMRSILRKGFCWSLASRKSQKKIPGRVSYDQGASTSS